jgi:MYXO-CTERM domain-containing protein
MVAGGTGAQTPITLWILGEGRYQPSSSPAAVISEKDLVWDFATSSSNYAELRQDLYASGAWLVETSGRVQSSGIAGTINYLIQYPELGDSGYGDAMGNGAEEEAQADYDKLWGALGKTPWLTRVSANLPRASLADDLVLGASADQSEVRGYLTAAKGINPPPCPTYACDDASTPSGAGSSGCAVGSESERTATYGATIAALGLLLMRRRRPAPR